jgi:hypothetical protein
MSPAIVSGAQLLFTAPPAPPKQLAIPTASPSEQAQAEPRLDPPVVKPIPQADTALWVDYDATAVHANVESYVVQDGKLTPAGGPNDRGRVFGIAGSMQAGAGTNNSLFLIGHSWDDGSGVFNRIMALARPNQLIVITTQVGKVCYDVDHIAKEAKADFATGRAAAQVPRPGWLVMISCYAAPGDPSTVWGPDVSVLYAQMQPCAA